MSITKEPTTRPDGLKPRTVGVPLTDFELARLDAYLARTGLKKKVFVRDAVLQYLDRAEQGDVT